MDPNLPDVDPGAVAAVEQATLPADVDPGEKKLVERWFARIRHDEQHDSHIRERYEADRKVARGESPWLVDTNLVGAILEILASFVYAKDPDFQVKVSESVNNSRAKVLGECTETIRIVVSKLLRNAGLKQKGKKWVRSAQTVGAGWLKPAIVTGPRRYEDPIVQNEINSLRENIEQVKLLQAEIAEGDESDCDYDAQIADLNNKIKALDAKLERQVAVGLALDFFRPDDVIVSSECGELVDYLDAPYITFRTYKSPEEAQAITGLDDDTLKKANRYTQRVRGAENAAQAAAQGVQTKWLKVGDKEAQSVDGFLCFLEVWSKRDGLVYTLIDGITDRFAKPAFAPTTGSRFYDGFLLGFHWIDGDRHPQSDVHQLKSLQDEYGRTRSNFALHRKRNIPMNIWDAGALPPTEMDKINSAEANENVAVTFTDNGQPMQNRVFRFQGTTLDPAMYTTQPITTDMEKVSGAQDAMQAGVAVAKTATEAKIQDSGFGARMGSRRDEFETVLGELGLWVAQVALQVLPEDVVVRIAGKDAVWPQLTVDEVMDSFDIEVKAGSTGKPDKDAMQAAWSTVLPMIENMITVVGNFRSQGPQMEWAAKPYVAMLTRTFDLLGMRDDVDKYLPQPPPPNPLQQMLGAIGAPTAGPEGAPPGAGPAPASPGPMAPALKAIGTPAGNSHAP